MCVDRHTYILRRIKSFFNGFVRSGFCTPGHRMLQTLHLRPVDGSTARMDPPGSFRSKRFPDVDRPTDGSIRGQPMLQVTQGASRSVRMAGEPKPGGPAHAGSRRPQFRRARPGPQAVKRSGAREKGQTKTKGTTNHVHAAKSRTAQQRSLQRMLSLITSGSTTAP